MAAVPARAPRTSPSRRAPARRRPQRRAPARRRPRHTPAAGFAAVPAAVGITVHAVGGIADSGVVHRLTRGRGWIALLGALLAGIVAANLYALSLSASSARTATAADELAQENSVLQSRISRLLAGGRAQSAGLGGPMVVPPPDSITYLRVGAADAARAADRLLSGEIVISAIATAAAAVIPEPVVAEPTATAPPAESEVAAEPVPGAVEPTPVTPEAAPAPEAAAPEATPDAGGVSG